MKLKCAVCNKTLKYRSQGFDCSCDSEKIFCAEHRIKDMHDCSTINKSILNERLSKSLPLIVADKIKFRI